MRGEKSPKWKGGVSFEPYCPKFNNDLRTRVREFFDNKCFLCHKTSTENGNNLHVHHINYDKMVCCNDITPLFVPLCNSCHSKTNNKREYWQEYFQNMLQNKYKNKCYFTIEEYQIIK